MNILRSINRRIDHWLTASEINAAGRMSLFRIVFGLYYLWLANARDSYLIYPPFLARDWHPLITFQWFWPTQPPNPAFYTIMPIILIVSAVLLTIGYHTRLATLGVLLSGMFLTGVYYSFNNKIDHGDTFMTAYIPAIMLFSNWGSYYSLDAILKKRRGIPVPPESDSWVYIWPMRAVLLLASTLYLGAAYWKLEYGVWFTNMTMLPGLLYTQNLIAIMYEFPLNPLTFILARTPAIVIPLQLSAIFFESLFWLSLTNVRLRNLFVSMAVLFHTFIAYFFYINADQMLILYMVFIDWKAVYQRLWPFKQVRIFDKLSSTALIAITVGLALLATLAWQSANPMQLLVNRGIMWIIAPLVALVVFVRTAFGLLRDANTAIRVRLRPPLAKSSQTL